ncbi:hypothetical protein Lepto7375DRAFT_2784 [Leptolyngbya sp. PCC 7375]|nr:hypothetical protein Lepto7375DRAFT_2784 [Leptolyngbya sp. PCC 7375]
MSYGTMFDQINNELNKLQLALAENNQLISALDTVQDTPNVYSGVIGGIATNLQSFYKSFSQCDFAVGVFY